MTDDELAQLELLSRTAPSEVDAFLDPIAQRQHERMGRRGTIVPGDPVFLHIAQIHASFNPHSGIIMKGRSPEQDLGELLAAAGLKAQVETLLQRSERGAPLFSPDPTLATHSDTDAAWPALGRFDIPSWLVSVVRRYPEPTSLVQQACACLHLLGRGPFQQMPELSWVRRIAQKRLSELLIAQPALLHQRLVFEQMVPSGPKDMASLGHSLAIHTTGGLPSRLDGYTDEQLDRFAHHPIVRDALLKRVPLYDVSGRPGAARRTLLGVFIEASRRLSGALLTSVLQLERLRKAARPRCTSAIPSRHHMLWPAAAAAFRDAWQAGDHDGALHLFAELRQSSIVGDSFRMQVLTAAPRGLVEGQPVVEAADIIHRLARLNHALRLAGVLEGYSAQATAEVMLQALFSLPDDDVAPFLNTAATLLSVEGASKTLAYFEAQGITLEALGKRIRASEATTAGTDPGSTWATALRIIETERSMARVIHESVAAGPVVSHSSAASHRSRRPSL